MRGERYNIPARRSAFLSANQNRSRRMDSTMRSTASTTGSRRKFLKSSAGVIAGTVTVPLIAPAFVHAAGSDVLRVGLVGCGGRGTGAASQALRADQNVRLTAMADAF